MAQRVHKTKLSPQESRMSEGRERMQALLRETLQKAETHKAWLEDNRYLSMSLFTSRKRSC